MDGNYKIRDIQLGKDKHCKIYIIQENISKKELIVKIYENPRHIYYKSESDILRLLNENYSSDENKFFVMYKNIHFNQNMFIIPNEVEQFNLEFLFYDYLPKLSLFDYLTHTKEKIKEIHAKFLCYKLLIAIEKLHTIDILHNKIDISNIMFDDDFNFKLIHFSEAKIANDKLKLNKDIFEIAQIMAKILSYGKYSSINYDRKNKVYIIFYNDKKNNTPMEESKFWNMLKLLDNINISKEFLEFFHIIINAKKSKELVDINELLKNEWLNEIEKDIVKYKNIFKEDFEELYNIIIEDNIKNSTINIDIKNIIENKNTELYSNLKFEENNDNEEIYTNKNKCLKEEKKCKKIKILKDQEIESNILNVKKNFNKFIDEEEEEKEKIEDKDDEEEDEEEVRYYSKKVIKRKNVKYKLNKYKENEEDYSSNEDKEKKHKKKKEILSEKNSEIEEEYAIEDYNNNISLKYAEEEEENLSFLENIMREIESSREIQNEKSKESDEEYNRKEKKFEIKNINKEEKIEINDIKEKKHLEKNYNKYYLDEEVYSFKNSSDSEKEILLTGGEIKFDKSKSPEILSSYKKKDLANNNILLSDNEFLYKPKKDDFNYLEINIKNAENKDINKAVNYFMKNLKNKIKQTYNETEIKINFLNEKDNEFIIYYEIPPINTGNLKLKYLDKEFKKKVKETQHYGIKIKLAEGNKNLYSLKKINQYYLLFNTFKTNKEDCYEHLKKLKKITKDILLNL